MKKALVETYQKSWDVCKTPKKAAVLIFLIFSHVDGGGHLQIAWYLIKLRHPTIELKDCNFAFMLFTEFS
jgi:hypothetical protein